MKHWLLAIFLANSLYSFSAQQRLGFYDQPFRDSLRDNYINKKKFNSDYQIKPQLPRAARMAIVSRSLNADANHRNKAIKLNRGKYIKFS